MSLSEEQLLKIATLSRLNPNPGQIETLRGPINQIMDMADQLSAQNTESVHPLAHPLEMIQGISLALRSDVVTETNQREKNMANAPSSQAGLFLVPKVID